MNVFKFLIFLSLLLNLSACKSDDDCPSCQLCETCEVCEVCEIPVGFKDYEVDFYTAHPDFVTFPTIYETVTEQILVKEAHMEGAFFETVTEQVLVKESSKRCRILDSETIHLVVNSEIDSIAEIVCYNFYDQSEFIEEEIPAEYRTISRLIVAQEGTGAEIPAVYETLAKKVIATICEITPTSEEQTFNRVRFRIPEDQSIQAYLASQFAQQSIVDCEEGNSFDVLE